MKTLKPVLLGMVIGLILGLWFGVNIGKDKRFYSNPFAEKNVTEQIKTTIGESMEKAGEKIGKMGEDIQGKPKN